MTYTIVARCDETKRLGIGIATFSLGVGGYCPFMARGVAALSTQAFANPALGPMAVGALAEGASPGAVMDQLQSADPGFGYRQVSIVGLDGTVAMHTGEGCRGWAGHEIGDGFAAFGNVLSGPPVVAAIAKDFRQSDGQELSLRLLRALEAGRDAGGQAGAGGVHLTERSAALIVRGDDIVEDLDLRVDLHDDAITELVRVHAGYTPYLPYYTMRARDPANTPGQDVWAKDNLGDSA